MHADDDAGAPPRDGDAVRDEFEQAIGDVWRSLAHSVARNHAAFGGIGEAVRNPDAADVASLTRAMEKYGWEEKREQAHTVELLHKLASRSDAAAFADEATAAWRCANGLERLAECGLRGWALAIQQTDGKYTLDEKARAEAGLMMRRLEEAVYWTLEAMRTHYVGSSGREVLAIAKKEADVAQRQLDASLREGERAHRERSASGNVPVPARVAYFDIIAVASHAGQLLAALTELALARTPRENGGRTGRAK